MAKSRNRFNETWHRLRDWDGGQTKSEMLSWQLIAADGYTRIDPSLPRGGPDGGKDARCERDGQPWVMAAYFAPSGQQKPSVIKKKLLSDMAGAREAGAVGIAFVTNQEIGLAERETLAELDDDLELDLFHLDRITRILQDPKYAQTREDFLDIVGGPPPMLIKAEVPGAVARAFLNDEEVFEHFVEFEAEKIRKRSDGAHARVREEKERRKREMAGRQPWEIAADSLGMLNLPDAIAPLSFTGLGYPGLPGAAAPEPEPEPLTDEQIAAEVQKYRDELRSRWPACLDYLAGCAWSGLRFRINNEAKSFLGDVQVILTFHGARGIDWLDPEDFELLRVEDPSWEPYSSSMYAAAMVPPVAYRPDDHPIEPRRNDAGDLEVTITLPRLRPHPQWRSDDYGEEIVLMVRPDSDSDEISVTYTATAEEYGDVYLGESFTIPVERVDMWDVLREMADASRDS